jgi:hypothetical protein
VTRSENSPASPHVAMSSISAERGLRGGHAGVAASGPAAEGRAPPDRWPCGCPATLADLVAMDTDEARGNAQAGSVEDWATESLLAARQAYQDPATGSGSSRAPSWGMTTRPRYVPVAYRGLYKACARLAWVLNDSPNAAGGGVRRSLGSGRDTRCCPALARE